MKLLLVFAHPDDECFVAGGTIAKLAKEGFTVKLLTATKGEAGELGTPPITTREEIGKVRESELRAAARILGINQVFFLDYIDGTLAQESVRRIARKIYMVLDVEKPDIVITFDKEGGSKHPDHVQISRSTTLAFKAYAKKEKKHVRLYYKASLQSFVQKLEKQNLMHFTFGKVRGTPKTKITTIVDIRDFVEIKLQALLAHRTQHKDVEKYVKQKIFKEFNFEFFKLVVENNII